MPDELLQRLLAREDAHPELFDAYGQAVALLASGLNSTVTATLADSGERSFEFATHQGRERFFEARVGLLPAALSTGIGSQVQKPLALVVVGGILLAPALILVVMPILISLSLVGFVLLATAAGSPRATRRPRPAASPTARWGCPAPS